MADVREYNKNYIFFRVPFIIVKDFWVDLKWQLNVAGIIGIYVV